MKKVLYYLVLFSSVLLVFLSTAPVMAAFDEIFHAENNIIFYDPDGTENNCGNNTVVLSGVDNAEKIWGYFLEKGLTPIAIAGIIGNFSAESALDPARKQNDSTKTLPDDGDGVTGYGIAQWTYHTRQAGLFAKMREAGLDQYYKDGWGDKNIDATMPVGDNDALLLVELDYAFMEMTDNNGDNIPEIINTKTTIADATTYFHEAFERSADDTMTLRITLAEGWYSKFAGISGGTLTTNCGGGVILGGMSGDQANAFMAEYKSISPAEWGTNGMLGPWDISATTSCTNDLSNCVAFTQYFINRYTTQHVTGLPNGKHVVSRLLDLGFVSGGTTPRPYAIFSKQTGSTICSDGLPCGHTGVVLGIEGDKIIIGEAGCSASFDWIGAHVYNLSDYTNGSYTYVYTDNILKGL
ncbi:MAG: phage tail-type lysozyme domain-containing protein [Candidatus Nomurabacteria bacterium]|nr:phage tail-type lysozyme domain-containing protein [Candidatus Nomurabacteria bacterium]